MLKNIRKVKLGNDYTNLIDDFKIKRLIFNYLFNEIGINKFKELEVDNNLILENIKKKKL